MPTGTSDKVSLDTDDDKNDGRTLDDKEFAQALQNRNDIFSFDNGKRLRNAQIASLAIGAVFGIWISTVPPVKIAPGFYERVLKERMAKLAPEQSFPAALQKSMPQKHENGKKHREIKAALKSYTDKHPKEQFTSASVVPQTPPAGQDSVLIRQGNTFKKQGNHDSAFASYKRVLQQNPRNVEALSGMGDLFLYTGLLDSAAAFYNAALAINPRSTHLHDGLGSVRYYLSDMVSNPNYAARRKIRDPARYIQTQYDSAIIEYTNAISLDSTNVDALTNRGVLRDIRKDYKSAIEDYSLAIKINPSFADAW